MMKIACPIVSPAIKNLSAEIMKDYPEECKRAKFDDKMCAMWVGYYNSANNKTPDFIPGKKELVNSIEKRRNLDGKSFLSVPEKVTYTKGGKIYEYTVIGSHIFAPNGQEVYAADAPNAGVDRIKIFANLRVQRGEAVIVEHKNNKYVVNDNNQIVSIQTGKIMQWGEENGDRKAILSTAEEAFKKRNTVFIKPTINRETLLNNLKDNLKSSISVGRSGWLKVFTSPQDYNGAPVITINIYNSGSDMDTEIQYRLNAQGNLESRNRWTSEDWEDNWKGGTSSYEAVNEYYEALKKETPQVTQQQSIPASYEGIITPEANTIFVFGSNPEGRHGAGAAKVAREQFGAVYGQGEGLQGNSYALPTKDLRVKENKSLRSISPVQITENIRKMYEVARQNPNKQFKIAYTNGLNEATLNGYTGAEMIQMFKDAGPIPSNVVFSKNWTNHWNEVQPTQQQSARELSEQERQSTQDEINKLTLADFNHMVVRDFTNKVTLQQSQNTQQPVQNELPKESSTARFGVVIDPNLKDNYKTWQQQHPEGIVAYRVNFNSYNTPAEVEAGHIGNPFSEGDNRGPSTVEQFYNWIVTGNNYGNPKATEEFRQAIIDKILATPNNVPILYYKELGRPSHATAIGYLVNNKQILQNARQQNQAQQQGVLDVTKAEFYSGGAKGADTVWKRRAETLGIKIVEYTPEDWDKLSADWKEKLGLEYLKVAEELARPAQPINSDSGKLVRRDMMQADKADAVFAIGTVIKPGEKGDKGYTNKTDHDVVDGGTAYAVQRGVQRGIPVYVFDQKDTQWKMWDANTKSFIVIEEPILTPNAATIGTRGIDNNGVQAIESILNKSFGISAAPKPRVKSEAYDSALQVQDNETVRFYRTFSPQQIKDRGAYIASLFSDILDTHYFERLDYLNDAISDPDASESDKNSARAEKAKILDPVNGRQYIAGEVVGIPQMMQEIKDTLQTWLEDDIENNGGERAVLFQNTIDYFENLFNAQASLDIEESEGIRIVGYTVNKETAEDEDAQEREQGDDETGHVVSGSDGWNFQVRFENPFESMSQKVRGMFYDIERPEAEKDDLGMTRHYSVGQIYASILTYFAKNVHSADDYMAIVKDINDVPEGSIAASIIEGLTQEEVNAMYPDGFPVFPAFEKMKSVYTWTDQVIIRLTNDFLSPDYNASAKYPPTRGAMASQLYSNFKKAFIPYGKIKLNEDGIIPLNYQMEERMQYDKLKATYNNRLLLTDRSVYDAQGRIVKDNVNYVADLIEELKAEFEEEAYWDPVVLAEKLEEDSGQYNDFLERARYIFQSFGIAATTDNIASYIGMSQDEEHMENMENHVLMNMFDDLLDIADALNKVSDDRIPTYNYVLDTIDSNKRHLWTHFFDGRGLITDASYMQSFYDSSSKKTKYSYSADNFLMQRFRGIAMGSREERRRYIEEKYGKYDWFRNQKTGEWRNKWLEFWYNLPDEEINELPYQNIDVVVEPREGKDDVVRKYVDWEAADIAQVISRSYVLDSWKKRDFTAMYLAPIFSDSPMSMTIRGPILSKAGLLGGEDESGNWKSGALQMLVKQELSRMKLVQDRKEGIKTGRLQPITNFDGKRGLQFCFIPELNDYVFEDGKKFIDKIMEMKEDQRYSARDIDEKIAEAVTAILDSKFEEYVRLTDPTMEGVEFNPSDEEKNRYYNMAYANAAIIQLTTVDLAFYPNATEFQKRFKEVYAGGTQLNTNSKYGMKTENVILLADDFITSPSYKRIAEVIDRNKVLSKESKDDIKAMFTDINVADAQAIRGMYAFRAVLDMLGKWDDNMEATLNRFKEGTWTREDFDTLYQIIKPFAYSIVEKNAGDGSRILVPQQHKNSEICALMIYDLISNGLGESPVYRALSRLMDEKYGIKGADGKPLIHMAQYESAGKVANQGVINISILPDKVIDVLNEEKYNLLPAVDDKRNPLPNDLEHAFENFFGDDGIKTQLDRRLDSGKITQEEYNGIIKEFRPSEDDIISMIRKKAIMQDSEGNNVINEEFVQTMPFDNYYEQQKTPAHHVDNEAVFGSQGRNIAPADLPSDFEMTVDSVTGEHTFKGGEETVDFLYKLLNENLIEDFFGKNGLKKVFESKESLRKAVEDIVRGNPKYGQDFADALQINKDTGEFNLSPNSPTVFVKMQEIITSLFKNRITKQKINGAALIQAAGIGLDENLRILFDENGKLKGAECYMPITSRKLFEPLLEEETIDGKKQLVLKPERLKKLGLDKAVGYRIPTENKSSMMPLIIKGFTPLQNGSAIVLPAEITTMAGSDFDVDKMFIMLTSFTVQNYAIEKAREDYEKERGFKIALNILEEEDLSEEDFYGREQTSAELKAFKKWFEKHKDEYELDKPIVGAVKYDFNKTPKQNGRKARNNMIIQMFYGILTSKSGAESLFNPQGFPDVEKAAKIVRIAKDRRLLSILKENLVKGNPDLVPPVSEIREQFKEDVRRRFPKEAEAAIGRLNNMSDEDVVNLYIETVKPEIPSEKVADALINESKDNLNDFVKKYGDVESPMYPQTFIRAHARNMAGVKQIGIYAVQASMAAKYQRATVAIKKKYRFKLNGTETHYLFQSNNGKTLKNDGQMVGASADNGKKPNLTDMGSTKNTATIIGLGLNMKLSHLDIALLVNQPYMEDAKYRSDKFKWHGVDLLHIKPAEITTRKLLLNIIDPSKLTLEEQNYIRSMCYKLLKLNEAVEFITKVSRADSPNGAMGNSYAKARVQRYKVDLLQGKMSQETVFPIEKIKETLSNDAVTVGAGENTVREQLNAQKMGLLHGFYALGINSFDNLMKDYFFGARKGFDEMIVKPLLYNQPDTKSDDDLYKLVDNIYISYIIYTLSGSPLFGNETNSNGSVKTMKQKREEYLNDFPGEFRRILSENEKVKSLLEGILEVVPDGNRSKIALKDVGSLSKEMRAEIEMRFNSLLYDDDPVVQKLAKDLFIYSYFRNGLQFTHDSFAHLFTTTFLLNFPVYNQTLQSLDRDLSETDDKDLVDNYLAQFLVTYPEAAYNVDDILNNDKVEEGDVTVNGDVLTIDLNNQFLAAKMRNDALSTQEKMPYPFIEYNNDLYILDRDKYASVPGKPEYHKIIKYATSSRRPLFSSQMSNAELAEQFPMEESAPMFDYPDIGDSYYPGAPMEYQTSNAYPYDNNDTGAPMDNSSDIPVGEDWSNADIGGVSSADVYRRQGEETLETQFCK